MPALPQWTAAVSPAYRRRAHVRIVIQGVDVTERFNPFLISVQVVLKIFGVSTASIELDDRDAKLAIPPDEAGVRIELGWAGSGPRIPLFRHVNDVYDIVLPEAEVPPGELLWQDNGMHIVYRGYVSSVESGFNRRGGGRRLWIDCHDSPPKGIVKEPKLEAWGDGKNNDQLLGQVMQKAAKAAGITIDMPEEYANIKRPFWIQDNESFQHFASRIAGEIGGMFSIQGDRAVIAPVHSTGSGVAMPTVEAVWGTNLISWRIKPFVGRPQWSGAKSRFFNNFLGQWAELSKSIGGTLPFGNASAVASTPNSAPNEQVGEQINEALKGESERRRGEGWCIINGEPTAQANGAMVIIGARPGVDGRYHIQEAEHNYTRDGGYTTRCQLDQPVFNAKTYQDWNWVQRQGDPGDPHIPPPNYPPDVFNWEGLDDSKTPQG